LCFDSFKNHTLQRFEDMVSRFSLVRGVALLILFSQIRGMLLTVEMEKKNIHYKVEHRTADFGKQEPYEAEGYLHVPSDPLLCQPATTNTSMQNRIAFVQRGNCSFLDKAFYAQTAGARGIVIGNNEDTKVLLHMVLLYDNPKLGLKDDTIQIPVVSITREAYYDIFQVVHALELDNAPTYTT